MAYMDSVSKIIETYFHAVTKEEFTYKGKRYIPKPLYVSPQFFHEFKCFLGCGACCSSGNGKFTLDYLPSDNKPPAEYIKRSIDLAENSFDVFTYHQKLFAGKKYCDNVNLETGACMVHDNHALSCDFEVLRFVHFGDHTWLGTRPYGRGWNMLRIDGERGAVCQFPKTSTEESRLNAIRKLIRLKEWTDSAKLETWIPDIIAWASEIKTDPIVFTNP